jgi:hypothetical protein
MKKLIIVGLMLCLASSLFALSEKWAVCGFEWGNFFENDGTYISSPGLNWSFYSFDDRKNIGTFMRMSGLYPLNVEAPFQSHLGAGLMTGVAFRLPVNERLNIHIDIAPQLILMSKGSTDDGDNPFSHLLTTYDLGVGANAGIKFDITTLFFINAGIELSYNFARYTSKTSDRSDGSEWTNTAGWAKDYSQFGVRPYFTYGLNYYWPITGYGKPPVVK